MRKVQSLIVAVALALAALCGVIVAYPAGAAPLQEATVPQTIVIANGATPLTAAFTSTSRYIGGYTILNYGGSLDISTTQTVTAKIQVSPDASKWYDYVTVHNAVSADATVTPAKTDAVWNYLRVVYTLGTANTVTPTLYLVLK